MSDVLPAVNTAVKTASTRDLTYMRDLGERVIATFLQAVVGALVVTQPLNLGMVRTAGLGGVAAAVSLLNGLVARWRGVANSGSLAKGV